VSSWPAGECGRVSPADRSQVVAGSHEEAVVLVEADLSEPSGDEVIVNRIHAEAGIAAGASAAVHRGGEVGVEGLGHPAAPGGGAQGMLS